MIFYPYILRKWHHSCNCQLFPTDFIQRNRARCKNSVEYETKLFFNTLFALALIISFQNLITAHKNGGDCQHRTHFGWIIVAANDKNTKSEFKFMLINIGVVCMAKGGNGWATQNWVLKSYENKESFIKGLTWLNISVWM